MRYLCLGHPLSTAVIDMYAHRSFCVRTEYLKDIGPDILLIVQRDAELENAV